MGLALLIYLAGVGVGLVVADAPPVHRVLLALAWPVGILAFLVTITALVAASAVLFPIVGAALVAVGVLWWTLVT